MNSCIENRKMPRADFFRLRFIEWRNFKFFWWNKEALCLLAFFFSSETFPFFLFVVFLNIKTVQKNKIINKKKIFEGFTFLMKFLLINFFFSLQYQQRTVSCLSVCWISKWLRMTWGEFSSRTAPSRSAPFWEARMARAKVLLFRFFSRF